MNTDHTPSPLEARVIALARQHDSLAETCHFVEYYPDVGRVPEHWRARGDVMRIVQAITTELRDTLAFCERWASHHGTKAHVTAEQALSVIQHHPGIVAITRSYADGKVPQTFDPYARIAELEALADKVLAARDGNTDELHHLQAHARRLTAKDPAQPSG